MRLLTVTSLYPNAVQPQRGVFVRERLRQIQRFHDVEATVIAPVPWFPLTSACFGQYAEFARVPAREETEEGTVLHPRYLQIPRIGSVISPLAFAHSLARAVQREGVAFDVIDAHFLFPDGVAAVVAAQRLQCPVALTARGSDVNLIPNEVVAGRWIRWALERADRLIAVSDDLGHRLGELAGGRSVAVIRNGVDFDVFKPANNRVALRELLNFSRFTLLSVGNLIDLKGHHVAIDALISMPGLDLVIVGDGPRRHALLQRAQRCGVADRVRIEPAMPQRDLTAYYAAADALVLASSHEGMPNVILESLASGTPVIATPTGGSREVLGDGTGGLLCERTPEAIANAVETLRAHPRSRAEVRSAVLSFNWRHCAEQAHAVLSELVDTDRQSTSPAEVAAAHRIGR